MRWFSGVCRRRAENAACNRKPHWLIVRNPCGRRFFEFARCFFSPSYGPESAEYEWAEAQTPPRLRSGKCNLRAVEDIVRSDATQ